MTGEENILQALNKALISNDVKDTTLFISQLCQYPGNLPRETLNRGLLSACDSGNKFLVHNLLSQKVNINCIDGMGNTPLMICAKKGFCDLARILLYNGAEINCVNGNGDSALTLSASSPCSNKMMELLLSSSNVNIFQKNNEGFTFLMRTVETFNLSSLGSALMALKSRYIRQKDLVSEADQLAQRLGVQNIYNLVKNEVFERKSAFLEAVAQRDLESVTFLMNSDFLKESFLWMISSTMSFYVKRNTGVNDEDMQIVKAIIEDINRPINICLNILEDAVKIGSCELVELICRFLEDNMNGFIINSFAYGDVDFIETILDFTKLGIDVQVCLRVSAFNGHMRCVNFILKKFPLKATSVIRDSSSGVFHLAVKNGNKKIMSMLLDKGADINGLYEAKTPFMFCQTNETAEFLVENGAG
ncbi:hypothetical protein Btru_034226 [Bulinus truncatus]|nr:hypothetical protein Btru_034226 [Bulinus truncatus]